jgi:hypothetical protein
MKKSPKDTIIPKPAIIRKKREEYLYPISTDGACSIKLPVISGKNARVTLSIINSNPNAVPVNFFLTTKGMVGSRQFP